MLSSPTPTGVNEWWDALTDGISDIVSCDIVVQKTDKEQNNAWSGTIVGVNDYTDAISGVGVDGLSACHQLLNGFENIPQSQG